MTNELQNALALMRAVKECGADCVVQNEHNSFLLFIQMPLITTDGFILDEYPFGLCVDLQDSRSIEESFVSAEYEIRSWLDTTDEFDEETAFNLKGELLNKLIEIQDAIWCAA